MTPLRRVRRVLRWVGICLPGPVGCEFVHRCRSLTRLEDDTRASRYWQADELFGLELEFVGTLALAAVLEFGEVEQNDIRYLAAKFSDAGSVGFRYPLSRGAS